MKLRAPISVLLAAVLLGGCSTIGSWFSKTKVEQMAELKPFNASARLEQVWKFRVGGAGKALIQPAVSGESVFAANEGGEIYRVSGGRQVWRARTNEDIVAGVGVSSGLVVVGTRRGGVAAFDAETGAPRWNADVGGDVAATPLVDGDLVVVRVGDARLVALEVSDGRRRWSYSRTTPPLSLRAFSEMRRADAYVFAGFSGGRIAAINVLNGQLAWEGAVTQPRGTTELERLSDVVGTPLLGGGMLCAGAFQGRVSCFDVTKGVAVWGRDISTPVGVAMDSEKLFVADERSTVHALDRGTGATLWKQDELKLRKLGRPLETGSFVAVADIEGWVHLLNTADGHFAARLRADNSPIDAPLAELDGGVVALSRDGILSYMKVR